MKKILCLVFAAAALAGCSWQRIEPGYVGVKVYRAGTDKGVGQEAVGVGRYWLTWNEELYAFPVFQQNYTWTQSVHEGKRVDESLTIQSKEGMGINMDLGISYEIEPSKVAMIFQKYHKGVDELTDVVLRNAVRDALMTQCSTFPVDEIIGARKSQLIKAAEDEVREEFKDVGIKIDKLFLIGEMRPPKPVQDALNAKIEATQRAIQAENEVRRAKAEADKAREVARGEADANAIKKAALTEELLRYEAIMKWDGHLPTVTGGGSMPFIQIQPAAAKATGK